MAIRDERAEWSSREDREVLKDEQNNDTTSIVEGRREKATEERRDPRSYLPTRSTTTGPLFIRKVSLRPAHATPPCLVKAWQAYGCSTGAGGARGANPSTQDAKRSTPAGCRSR